MFKRILTMLFGGVMLLSTGLPLATASTSQASSSQAVVTVAATQQASVAASCRGRSCTGKNPQTTGCEKDARTIDRVRPGGGGPRVELRYSPTCRAAWARIQKANPSWDFKIEGRGGPRHTGHASLRYRVYTKMIGKPKKFRACVAQYSSDAWTCTRWH